MLDQKQKEYNWYFTQCFVDFVDGSRGMELFVTFADTPSQAKNFAAEYVLRTIGHRVSNFNPEKDCHLYQKNYIRDSRALVAAGKFCGHKPANV